VSETKKPPRRHGENLRKLGLKSGGSIKRLTIKENEPKIHGTCTNEKLSEPTLIGKVSAANKIGCALGSRAEPVEWHLLTSQKIQ
jgi:hypothetical protein